MAFESAAGLVKDRLGLPSFHTLHTAARNDFYEATHRKFRGFDFSHDRCSSIDSFAFLTALRSPDNFKASSNS